MQEVFPRTWLRRTAMALSPLAARALRPVSGPLGLAALGAFTLLALGAGCNEIEVTGDEPYLSPAEEKLAERTRWPATLEGDLELDISEPAPGNDLYIYGTLFTDTGEVLVFAMDSQLRRWGVMPGDRVRAKVRPSDSDLVGDDSFYDLIEVVKLPPKGGDAGQG